MKGIFAINKPKKMSSHDVVNRVRKITGVKRVGHGGTLDPLATGVLVIAVGRENTKLLDQYVKGDKEYVATLKLGYTSTTDDEEGEKIEIDTNHKPNSDEIEETLQQFIGKIQQTPPAYSAMKVGGKRAYKLARSGKDVKLESREVNIKQIELLEYDYPFLKLKVTTGPGVYIRSLARDIGRKLATGAYLADLERIRVGEFTIENALSIESLEKEKTTEFS